MLWMIISIQKEVFTYLLQKEMNLNKMYNT